MCMALTSSDLELRLSCISFHMRGLLIRHSGVVWATKDVELWSGSHLLLTSYCTPGRRKDFYSNSGGRNVHIIFICWCLECVPAYFEYGRSPNSTSCWRQRDWYFFVHVHAMAVSKLTNPTIAATTATSVSNPATCSCSTSDVREYFSKDGSSASANCSLLKGTCLFVEVQVTSRATSCIVRLLKIFTVNTTTTLEISL